MSTVLAERPKVQSRPTQAPAPRALNATIAKACAKIAPLWPLKNFVAVNPFLGFSGQSFAATCATLRRVAQVDMLMPRSFYRRALADGLIEDEDLERALVAAPVRQTLLADAAGLKEAAARAPSPPPQRGGVVATVAEVLDALAAGDRQVSRTAFMIDEVSKWCAASGLFNALV